MSAVKDLTGQRYGRLVVICREGSTDTGRATWLCKCDCGTVSVKIGKLLVNGHCKSCGCGEYENRVKNCTSHKLSNTRLYNIWCGMKQRCYYTKHKDYHNYGGRGIVICDSWKDDFLSFYGWALRNGYNDDLTIDRIDSDGNYSPDNCRWVTAKDQARNTRHVKLITIKGETKTATEWCDLLKLDYSTLKYHAAKNSIEVEDEIRKRVINCSGCTNIKK